MKKRLTNENDYESVIADNDDYNSYYELVSTVLRIFSFLLFALLLLFVVATAFASASEFSYDNLEYIMRNFALTLEENKEHARLPIRYNPDPMNQFASFGEGMAICSSSTLSIYSASGRLTCNEAIQYRNPIMVSSAKYVLLYDEGTGSYSLYNSFAKVHSDTIDKPIRSAVLSDNGYYALVTSSDEYTSAVEVYNSRFSLISRYNKNAYVYCVDISDDDLLIVTAESELGVSDFSVEVLISKINDPDNKFEFRTSSQLPLGCNITSEGFITVFSDSVLFLDKSGDMMGSYDFEKNTLYDYAFSETNCIILLKPEMFEVAYELICFNQDSSVQYRNNFFETVFDIASSDKISYVLSEDNLYYFDENSNKNINIESADYGCRLVSSGDDTVYFCSDTSAMVISGIDD